MSSNLFVTVASCFLRDGRCPVAERVGFRPTSAGNEWLPTDERGHTVDGMRDKMEGKLKETEGKLTDDELREKQGQAQQKVGEGKEQLEDAKDEARERI